MMKLSCKLPNNKARQSLLISAVAAIFLVQGCCIPPNLPSSRKKSCNCRDDIPVYAASDRSSGNPDLLKQPFVSVSEGNSVPPLSIVAPVNQNIPSVPAIHIPGKTKKHNVYSEKKLPLGIRSVSTSIIASPSISFQSNGEDNSNAVNKNKPGIGFQFGIGTHFGFSNIFAVSTSLLFKQQNAKEVSSYSSPGEPGGNPVSQEFESRYSYSYLSVPVLAEVKLSNQLTATAGPEINFLLGASVKSIGYGDSEKTSITKYSVKAGAGMQLGLKYDIPGSPLAVQLQYDHRLSRLNEKNNSDYDVPGGGGNEPPARHMRSLSLGLLASLCDLFKKDQQ